ncbi:hypothetical protein [Actinacidiphila acidipaludis]|nr:hypothetical protein [Streptomyces acidipaludis]
MPDGDEDSDLRRSRERYPAPPLGLAGCEDDETAEPNVVRGID